MLVFPFKPASSDQPARERVQQLARGDRAGGLLCFRLPSIRGVVVGDRGKTIQCSFVIGPTLILPGSY